MVSAPKIAGQFLRQSPFALLIWGLAAANVLSNDLYVQWAGIGALLLFIGCIIHRVKVPTRRFIVLLTAISALSILLGADLEQLPPSLKQALGVTAFLQSLMILRATIDNHRTITEIRRHFLVLPSANRSASILLITHVLSVVLSVGAMSIFAPLMRYAPNPQRQRAAELSMQGCSMMVMWSPFTIAMASVTTNIPQVSTWQIVGAGMLCAGLGLVGLIFTERARMNLAVASDLLRIMAPLLVPASVMSTSIILLSLVFGLSIVSASIPTIPPFCFVWSLLGSKRALPKLAVKASKSLLLIDDEIVLFSIAVVMGGLVASASSAADLPLLMPGGDHPPYFYYLLAMTSIVVLPILGIHMIVPTTIAASVLSPLVQDSHLNSLILALILLAGWSSGSMLGRASMAVATASALYKVPPQKLLFGSNLRFAFSFVGILSVLGAYFYR